MTPKCKKMLNSKTCETYFRCDKGLVPVTPSHRFTTAANDSA